MARIRIGIGGWVYAPWRGAFYPADLPQSRELHYASRHVTSIEINGTFYGTQKPASFRRWHDETPGDFVFSVKGPRFATHRRVLAEAGSSIERFFSSGVLELGDKLGPILWQFPATTKFDAENFAAFLSLLPRRMDNRELRHVIEVTHQSFATPAFIDLLRAGGVAVSIVDSPDRPAIHDITADFVYARLRRSVATESTGYPPAALELWANRLRVWSVGGEPEDVVHSHPQQATSQKGRDCFAYFISGAKERAPAAAQRLIEFLSH